MNGNLKHISICICTYKRPAPLRRLLDSLRAQETAGLFTFSVVIADNDQTRSAEIVAADFAQESGIPVQYCVEARQNIALARNKAVENAHGDFVAFIDDDEFPEKNWLLILYQTWEKYQVAGVLGPVKRYFDDNPPRWLVNSDFYERPVYPNGTPVEWSKGRTGNLFLDSRVFLPGELPFRPEFRAGEDQDFFRRKIEQGFKFIWTADAIAYEVIPPARWKRMYMLRKALLRGATARLQPSSSTLNMAKSAFAVAVYAVALPFAQLFGHHRFMSVCVRLCDHLGKLLAWVGINPIKEQYVTD